jgi:hypothetical protein
VYEKITREIPLLPGSNQALWQTPPAVFCVQENLASLEKKARQKEIQNIVRFLSALLGPSNTIIAWLGKNS